VNVPDDLEPRSASRELACVSVSGAGRGSSARPHQDIRHCEPSGAEVEAGGRQMVVLERGRIAALDQWIISVSEIIRELYIVDVESG
jgi:hypothetical protein